MRRVSFAFALIALCGTALAACSAGGSNTMPVTGSRGPAVNACPVDTGCPTPGGYHTATPTNATVPFLGVCPAAETAACGSTGTPSPPPEPLRYGGGELIGGQDGPPTRIYIDYWGWQSDSAGEQARLNSFLSSVGGSPWLNTVTQYSCCGHTDQFGDIIAQTTITNNASMLYGTFSDASTAPSLLQSGSTYTQAFENAVKPEVLSMEQHFGGDASAVYIIALPTQHWSFVNVGECGYHQYATDSSGHDVAFAVIPYIPDAGTLCGANSVGGPLDGVSIVTGHELAEALTDPVPFTGFSENKTEVADLCAWSELESVPLSGQPFAMQPLWSNAAASTANPYGACVLSYP